MELARFLTAAGYDVRLFHPRYAAWRLGRVDADCPVPTSPLPFTDDEWTAPVICEQFRGEVRRFDPEAVILTDCWNFRPLLGLALNDWPVLQRLQAHEGLCPLNNLRLQPVPGSRPVQCPNHQLASAATCHTCLGANAATSGSLHQAERRLAGVGTPQYDAALRQAFREAAAVLTLNPLTAEAWRPWCRRTEVITWGMDPARFPPPESLPFQETGPRGDSRRRILFAGLPDEPIKGFRTLLEAGERLWQKRQDFEILATGDPPQQLAPFARTIGWQSQQDLPAAYRTVDAVAVPTLVQDGLSRTAVEAMASGRPVIASRLGTMPWLVADGLTGLLCEPGDPADWARGLNRLLDDPSRGRRMGQAGRQVYLERFTWPEVIRRQWSPLLAECGVTVPGSGRSATAGSGSPHATAGQPVLERG